MHRMRNFYGFGNRGCGIFGDCYQGCGQCQCCPLCSDISEEERKKVLKRHKKVLEEKINLIDNYLKDIKEEK